MDPVSLSAPVTVQVREYIDPATGVATLGEILTVVDGSENECEIKIIYIVIVFCCQSLTVYSDRQCICQCFTTYCCFT